MKTRGQERLLLKNKCTLSKILYSKLHRYGYVILKNKLSTKVKSTLDSTSKSTVIFNNSQNDGLRRQISVKPVPEMLALLQKYFPNKIINGWYLLHSLPGCHEQIPHTDYQPNNDILTVNSQDMPLAALTSISKSAKLLVWNIKFNVSGKPKIIKYNQGDILVFRGDLVHAGSEYEEENIRLHVYLDSPLVKRELGKTFRLQ